MIPVEDLNLINGSRYCVIVVDMHEGHIGKNATVPVPNGDKIVERLENFLTRTRTLGVPIVHVMLRARRSGLDTHSNPFWHSANVLRDRPRIGEHNIEKIEPVISPKENDFFVDTKKRYSCFYGTDLEILLRSLKIDAIFLTGLTADVCVMNTAFDAFNRDLKVFVVSDCTETVYPEDKEAALRIISRRLGWVVDSEEALKLIQTSAVGASPQKTIAAAAR